MSEQASTFVPVARADEVEEGRPKAVRIEGRSVALFRHQGTVYATDNQCPHMGYPLTRGRVRNGVLTCDWHGWSYDMRGGGCFTGGCDDLDTYPVEERNGQVFIDVAGANSKRGDAHFLLLKEGLLSGDNWTLSKAIAILLARGVSEDETLNLLVEHMGRFIATERGPDGGRDVALLVNGVKVARLYEPADRLIPLMMAASGAAGRAGDRPQIHPLPQPVNWDKLARWIRVFSADKTWEGIEKCLVTARHLGDCDDRIVPLLYECAVEPYLLGMTETLIHLGYLAELLEEFGWDRSQLLVCNLAAKMLGRNRPAPQEARREAIDLFAEVEPVIAQYASGSGDFDSDLLATGLVSGDIEETFGAVTRVLEAGADIEQVVSTMVLLAADRMARTPVNMSPGWFDLNHEMVLAASVRTARRFAGDQVAARALYHAAWQFFENRWLNITPRPLRAHPAPEEASTGQDEALAEVIEAIETIQIREVGRLVREYLHRGFDGDCLLRELGQTILKDDNGWHILNGLRTVSEEWSRCAGHPARGQLLVGLARWATDVRRNTGSQSAVQTAQRFARGETAVELYE